ncbi:MAG TPA: bifunctional (p)ppGpp synthetase/guanosine-3',5'-bis(diphosphate) 3'-pyrophosphohydrolase [Burkholderiales bacterium]|nr:bifunctional (p)ppGpp synthetase/guanosine-3',5'-bis(diphosphate) 3'-pyrophosphohydrolase [Burkholderiales bacterium]
MVKVTSFEADTSSGQWLAPVVARLPPAEADLVRRADERAALAYEGRLHATGEPWLEHARAAARIVAGLGVGGEAISAMLLLGAVPADGKAREEFRTAFGPGVLTLVEGVASMAQVQALRSRNAAARSADRASQLEALRKMFLAMAQDVRVVLIKLADQVQRLRELASRQESDAREEAARETLELFAPLGNRLGVWQLKWELEDLAFRCLESQTYKSIAGQLDEKRRDRETYIAEVIRMLGAELQSAGIRAEVTGRPKHIYSIWRKLQRKNVALGELSDVRAVRVLVDDVKDCYAALGVAHNLWTPIPREFDDYIARPKANDYRSLHTAVVGPGEKILEIQIRTHEMHRHAELGVAAHWRYKESARADSALDEKLSWLRGVLEWKDQLADASELAEHFRTDLFQDMVYVVTPQGRVVDLPRGSTPIDFAYHLHSELGHRCRGAKVNGQIVPLTYVLSNGQSVEIIAAKEGGPSRDWLNPALGYIKSNRARTKVRQWFNNRQLEEAVIQGRTILEKDLQRLGKTGQNLEELASRLEFASVNDLFAAIGRSEVTPRQLQAAVLGDEVVEEKQPVAPVHARPAAAPSGILIVGVDKLLTVLARCCKPAPPDAIIGFVSRGRGVTIHRADCRNVARLPQERLIASDWGDTGASKFPVDVELVAGNHPALMRDVLDVFTREKVRVVSSASHSEDLGSKMTFTLEVDNLAQLTRLLAAVRDVPGVESARRK